jgi:hypothetical protein
MERRAHRKSSVHVNFRIPLELKIELEDEAKRHNMNLNALVTQIMTKHMTYDRKIERPGSVVLRKELFSRILDKVSVEEMERIGSAFGPKIVKRAFGFLDIGLDLDNLVNHYFQPMGSYSGWYRFNMIEGNPTKLLLEHEYGLNWSVFLKYYNTGLIKSITGVEPEVEADDSLITIRL